MSIVKISPEAAKELEEAAVWYESEQIGLGSRFLASFEHALTLLKEPNPPLTPVKGEAANLGAKKLLHRFPFPVITVELGQTIVVAALAHNSRKPGY